MGRKVRSLVLVKLPVESPKNFVKWRPHVIMMTTESRLKEVSSTLLVKVAPEATTEATAHTAEHFTLHLLHYIKRTHGASMAKAFGLKIVLLPRIVLGWVAILVRLLWRVILLGWLLIVVVLLRGSSLIVVLVIIFLIHIEKIHNFA